MLSFAYWLTSIPPSPSGTAEGVWGALGFTCLLAAFLVSRVLLPRVAPPVNRPFWRRIARFLIVTGVVLLVFLFFRVEGIPFLAARFWLLLLAAVDVAWIATIARYAVVQLPKERKTWEAERERRRYVR